MNKKLKKIILKAVFGLLISQKKTILKHIQNNLQSYFQRFIPFRPQPQKASWKRILFWTIISGLISITSKILISKTSSLAYSK